MMPSQQQQEAPTTAAKEKKRALPTEFERQVHQIRVDILTVRANLNAAERALQGVPPPPSAAEMANMPQMQGNPLMQSGMPMDPSRAGPSQNDAMLGGALPHDMLGHQRLE